MKNLFNLKCQSEGAQLIGVADLWKGSQSRAHYYNVDGHIYRQYSTTQEEWTGKTIEDFDPNELSNWHKAREAE